MNSIRQCLSKKFVTSLVILGLVASFSLQAAYASNKWIVLHDGYGCTGTSIMFQVGTSPTSFGTFNDRANSITLPGLSSVTLYDNTNHNNQLIYYSSSSVDQRCIDLGSLHINRAASAVSGGM